jgi:hypothetical protein
MDSYVTMYNLFIILLKEYEDIRVLSRQLYGSVLNKTESNLKEEDARRARVAMNNYIVFCPVLGKCYTIVVILFSSYLS